jgi:hypothetical protein
MLVFAVFMCEREHQKDKHVEGETEKGRARERGRERERETSRSGSVGNQRDSVSTCQVVSVRTRSTSLASGEPSQTEGPRVAQAETIGWSSKSLEVCVCLLVCRVCGVLGCVCLDV